jgi:hypothetical protein
MWVEDIIDVTDVLNIVGEAKVVTPFHKGDVEISVHETKSTKNL